MNGNRGAKGSIKDRLISMLYRMRYKEKEVKEKDYNIKNKEKQVKYINNLQTLKETEDISILDDEDKERLENIKIDAHFRINPSHELKIDRAIDLSSNNSILIDGVKIKNNNIKASFVTPYSRPYKRKGISEEVNFKLDSLSQNKLSLQADIKKEKKKTQEEIIILKEVNSFIDNSKKQIDSIKEDIEELKKLSKEKNKEINKTEEKYIEIRKKIDKLKKQYEAVSEKYDLSEFSILESIKLIDSINNYKSLASLNEMDMMLNVCKKEIEKIDSIIIIDNDKKKIGANIEETKEDQKNVKIKFHNSKVKTENVKDIGKEIEYELNRQKEMVDSLYEKAYKYETHARKELEIIGHRNMISSMLNIAGGILTLPFTGLNIFGIALGATMVNKGLKELNKDLPTREKIVLEYNYEDISKQISEVKDKTKYIDLVLSDSLNEIYKLKKNFKEEFSQYNNIIPEYQEVFEKLNDLEKSIKEKQGQLNKLNAKINKESEMNDEKLKKIGKL